MTAKRMQNTHEKVQQLGWVRNNNNNNNNNINNNNVYIYIGAHSSGARA